MYVSVLGSARGTTTSTKVGDVDAVVDTEGKIRTQRWQTSQAFSCSLNHGNHDFPIEGWRPSARSFSAPDQHGNTRTLEEFKGSKLVLYFYPKDNTPGCTSQACNLNDNLDTLAKEGYNVLGVSKDPAKSHHKFIDKFGLEV